MTTRQWINFIVLTIIWGASFLWIKIAVQETGPFTIVAIRLVFALLALLGFLLAERPAVPRGKMWLHLAILGMISTAIPWLCNIWAEKYIDSGSDLNSHSPPLSIQY